MAEEGRGCRGCIISFGKDARHTDSMLHTYAPDISIARVITASLKYIAGKRSAQAAKAAKV